ncbi:hypothetical protein E2C01_074519 [Portunus trituberculatus]|uniref:Uncharacterized protein n=1 Tax=Portunus trituberculatus TaxID=210409 RepID=A0A5B7IDQ2_PORTR|nr:hypothetical protein [Portunus trituberculatus]
MLLAQCKRQPLMSNACQIEDEGPLLERSEPHTDRQLPPLM